jgi:transcriptional regulator with XRE-family HTH domain
MAYPAYLKERARELRIKKQLTLDELAERLALPKTTVWHWIKDLPLAVPRRENPHPGTQAMQAKYQKLREDAYAQGRREYEILHAQAGFRDFVVLYIAEGYKRGRNRVAIGNSDASVVAIADAWLRLLSYRPIRYWLQHHADQDVDELRRYWGTELQIDGAVIALQRKSNSGQLTGRTWRSVHGVLTVCTNDTLLRARLQAWIDTIRDGWRVDSRALRGA